jgi:hypothetical protein
VTADGFRKLALALPEAEERAHMGHPDFRVGGRIFATLSAPGPEWGALVLTPEQQRAFCEGAPRVFVPVKGGWGLKGATNVSLRAATAAVLKPALLTAWRNRAPKKLLEP